MEKIIIEKLFLLIQMDVDSIHEYQYALNHISHGEIHKKLTEFREDHIQITEENGGAIVNG